MSELIYPEPFLAVSAQNNELILIYGRSQLLNQYFFVELFATGMGCIDQNAFKICPPGYSVVLYGRDIKDVSLSFPPFLVVEKSSGDILLAIKSIDNSLLCVKSRLSTTAVYRVGSFRVRKPTEIEVLPKGFQIEIKQIEIIKIKLLSLI